MFTDFMLAGKWFTAMDSAQQHNFAFNEAVSFMVSCDTQEEIDFYWDKLSAVPEAEQCGWLKDKYGVSWQIVPAAMGRDDEQRHARANRSRDAGVPAHEEVRYCKARSGLRREMNSRGAGSLPAPFRWREGVSTC